MEIEFLILADAVQAINGKLYMLGGGWTQYKWPSFPAPVRLGIALGILVGWNETNQRQAVQVSVLDEDGRQIIPALTGQFEVGRPPGLSQGSRQRAVLAINAEISLPKPGRYEVRAAIDSVERHVEFEANLTAAPV